MLLGPAGTGGFTAPVDVFGTFPYVQEVRTNDVSMRKDKIRIDMFG